MKKILKAIVMGILTTIVLFLWLISLVAFMELLQEWGVGVIFFCLEILIVCILAARFWYKMNKDKE